jgi:hypothetical protein
MLSPKNFPNTDDVFLPGFDTCRLLGRCQRFEKHTVSIFTAEDGDNVSPERWSLRGGKTQKNNIVILTALRTSNLS